MKLLSPVDHCCWQLGSLILFTLSVSLIMQVKALTDWMGACWIITVQANSIDPTFWKVGKFRNFTILRIKYCISALFLSAEEARHYLLVGVVCVSILCQWQLLLVMTQGSTHGCGSAISAPRTPNGSRKISVVSSFAVFSSFFLIY